MRRLVWVVLVACSGPRAETPHPKHDEIAQAEPPTRGPDDRECDALIAHAIELRVRELPPDARAPTAADRETSAGELRAAFGPDCHKLPRTTVQCALAAETTAAMTSCDR